MCAISALAALFLVLHFLMCIVFIPVWYRSGVMMNTPLSEIADVLSELVAAL